MARARRKSKKPLAAIAKGLGPTPEQASHGHYVSVFVQGEKKYRRIPIIDQMLDRGDLLDREHRALSFYREQAQLAERSPVKSCLDDSKGGGTGGLTLSAAITSAIITTARIERDLGSLLDIARAVAVDDKSLSQWCVAKHGGRERYNDKGVFIAMVPVSEKINMHAAKLELRHAAARIIP